MPPEPLSKLRAVTETASLAPETRPPSGRRTIARLWADAAGPERTAYLVEDGATGAGSRGARSTSACARTPTDCSRGMSGRETRSPCSHGTAWRRCSTSRSPASAQSASRSTRRAPPRTSATCSRTPRRSASSARTRSSWPRSRRSLGVAVARHVLTFADLPALGGRGREHAEANPSTLDDTSAAVDDEDLYTIIYTSGRPGPPKGCMPPQLLRDGEHRRPDGDEYYRPDDVMLLYLPLAHNYGRLMLLLGAYVGYRSHSCPTRCASPSPSASASDPPPSVPRVYEKVYAAAGALPRRRAEETPRRLGAPRRSRGPPSRGRGGACPSRPTGEARACRSPRVREGTRAHGRPPPHAGPPAAPPGTGDRRVLRRDRRAHHRGVRAHRAHDRGLHEPS